MGVDNRRVTIIVPEGALDEPTEITIAEASEPVAGQGVGPVWELGPSGTTFSEPV